MSRPAARSRKFAANPAEPRRRPPSGAASASVSQAAFDRWFDDQLRHMYDPVLDEPVPADLLDIVERHRRRTT